VLVPDHYAESRPEAIRDILDQYPMAILITSVAGGTPHATNCPTVIAEAPDRADGLPVSRIWGHMNIANQHWFALREGLPAKLIYTGPSGYVSPVSYPPGPAAPTWNFVTVHVTGRLHPVDAADETLAVVRRTARAFESRFGDGWDESGSVGYFQRIQSGVGAFTIDVDTVEAMFNLSQDKPEAVRRAVIKRCLGHQAGHVRDLGQFMQRFEDGEA
jgi:transcriptional regulator